MTCKNCGAELNEGAKFCKYCGTKIEGLEVAPVEEVKPVEEKTVVEETPVEIVEPENNSPKKGLGIASLIIGIISLILSLFLNVLMFVPAVIGLILGICCKTKCGQKTAGIILNALSLVIQMIVIALLVFVLKTAIGFLPNAVEKIEDKLNESNIEEYIDEVEDIIETKVIGNDQYGYLTVDEDWKDYPSTTEGIIQYVTDEETITMSSFETESVITLEQYADILYASLGDQNATNMEKSTTTVSIYNAYKITGQYEGNQYFEAYVIDALNGKLYSIIITAPDKYDDCFDIIDTFSTVNN